MAERKKHERVQKNDAGKTLTSQAAHNKRSNEQVGQMSEVDFAIDSIPSMDSSMISIDRDLVLQYSLGSISLELDFDAVPDERF